MQTLGLNMLIADLARAGLTIKPRVNEEIREVADQVADTMRSLAPVASGALRDSIEVESVNDGAEVGPTVPYAHYVEYGTSDTAPQPYAGPAMDQHIGDFIGRIVKVGGDI